jgi:hypothetical protein
MPVTINGTTGIAGANGSASTPAVQGEDTNTGVFFPAADTIAFAEGGVEVARFDASGNFGVGTTSPGARLEVYQTGEAASLRINNPTTTGFSTVVFMEGSSARGQIWGGNSSYSSYGGAGSLNYSANSGPHVWHTNYTERARIDASGNLLVAMTAAVGVARTQIAYQPNLNVGLSLYPTNSTYNNASVTFLNTGGTTVGFIYQNGSSTQFSTSSDYRLKENVQPMQDALAVIAQLNPVTYTWKADGSDGQGFIAHELQAVVPDCVTGEKDAVDAEGNPQYQGVDTSFLVATLVKAVQELTARIAALEAAQ